jgi:hypothetical protein
MNLMNVKLRFDTSPNRVYLASANAFVQIPHFVRNFRYTQNVSWHFAEI